MNEIESIEHVSRHPVYGIVSYYNQICIEDEWYTYDRERDRLVRSTSRMTQEDLYHVNPQ